MAPIDFKEHFMGYAQKMYTKREGVIDRFIMAQKNRKLAKRQFSQACLIYKELKKEVYTQESSESDIEYDILTAKI